MSKIKDLLAHAEKNVGVTFIGLERKTARIRNGVGSELKDVLGWDVIVREKDGTCYEYYVAQPPLIGMTQPQPVKCPLGIIPFDSYKIDIDKAIKLFHSQDGGDTFTDISLSWPLVHPQAPEPYWYFRTNLGNNVVIGANSGQIKGFLPTVVLYMAKPSH
jgi:hypothetical protein